MRSRHLMSGDREAARQQFVADLRQAVAPRAVDVRSPVDSARRVRCGARGPEPVSSYGAPGANWERSAGAWKLQLCEAGFADIVVQAPVDYRWYPAFVLTAGGGA